MARAVGPTAALAGVPAGIQAQGVWAGRRQLFVRFAAEAETATMYTADALAGELKRLSERSIYHSISVAGRDSLGNADFIAAAFQKWAPVLPVMLDTDGQRPEAVEQIKPFVKLIQVLVDFAGPDAMLVRALETLRAAGKAKVPHALVIAPREETSDSVLLRLIEQAHGASEESTIIIHPTITGERQMLDRRWSVLLEHGTALHADLRVLLRVPPPAGMK